MIFLSLSLLCTFAYIVIIFLTIRAWRQMDSWDIPKDIDFTTKLSILIPARNEADNIVQLLDAISAQNYPQEFVQIIVIDDHSEDNTVELVKQYPNPNISLIKLADLLKNQQTQSFKKVAIETGIEMATGDLIIQTDADCIMGKNWLASVVAYHQLNDVKIATAPVNFHQEQNVLEKFQSLDFLGMMGVTGAGIHHQFMRMCNGANLSYPKSIFKEVNGFVGNEDKASGDDMFLMHKIAVKYPDKIGFIKSTAATVFTRAKPTFKSFYQQRLRWATKNGSYEDKKVLMVNMIVFLTCFLLFAAFFALPLSPFYLGISILVLFFGKGIADFFFLNMMSKYFGREDLMRTFPISLMMHNSYIFIIGIAANIFKTYEWKGRKVQ